MKNKIDRDFYCTTDQYIICGPENSIVDVVPKLVQDPKIEAIIVTRKKQLVGIVTRRDIYFLTNKDLKSNQSKLKIKDLMTSKNLVTASQGISFEEVVKIIHQHRIEKLLIVDFNGNFEGLISRKKVSEIGGYLKILELEEFSRPIEFPPGCHEAGLTILSYFGTILRNKYPEKDIGFRIEQKENKVIMTIITSEGDIEIIEKCFDEYGMVVLGHTPIEQFLPDPIESIALKNKLEIANLELRQTKELLNFSKEQYNFQKDRIFNMENEVVWLREQVGRLIAGQLDNSGMLLKLFSLESKCSNNNIEKSLNLLSNKIEQGIKADDEHEIKQALVNVKKNNPSLFDQVSDLIIKGSVSGAAGNFLYIWIQSIMSTLPK
ncbi:hypothetical protein JCM14469_43250 [Desulfatiferula olefinivorans]